MTVLYIDCTEAIAPQMLLGALIDMGASVGYVEQCMADAGCQGQILHSPVSRQGMEATFAYCTEPSSLCDAVAFATECFLPDKIVCGNLSETIDFDWIDFLNKLSPEISDAPDGYVMCDGYGAAPVELSDSAVMRVVLYNCGEPDMLLTYADTEVVAL